MLYKYDNDFGRHTPNVTPKKRLFSFDVDDTASSNSNISLQDHHDTLQWSNAVYENSVEPNSRKRFRRSSYCDSTRFSDSTETPDKPLRSKWTFEETKSLVKGCYEYGVGAWKRILKDPKYSFHGRTAVDLKDRFRTIFPKQYNLLYSKNADSQVSHLSSNFRRINRRPRTKFTHEDDLNLLLGVEKYGCSWSKIVKDASLNFSNRHSMDLRDRFRIAFPESYEKLGYAPKFSQQTPRSKLRVIRNEGFVREESRQLSELCNSPSPFSRMLSQTPTSNAQHSPMKKNDCTSTDHQRLLNVQDNKYPFLKTNYGVTKSTAEVDISKAQSNQENMLNKHTEIIHSTPISNIGSVKYSPVKMPTDSSCSLYDVDADSSSSLPTTPVNPIPSYTSTTSSNDSILRTPIRKSLKHKVKKRNPTNGDEVMIEDEPVYKPKKSKKRYSPVKHATVAEEHVAGESTNLPSKIQSQANSITSTSQTARYSPVKKAPYISTSNQPSQSHHSIIPTSLDQVLSPSKTPMSTKTSTYHLNTKKICRNENTHRNQNFATNKTISSSIDSTQKAIKTCTASRSNLMTPMSNERMVDSRKTNAGVIKVSPIRFSPVKKIAKSYSPKAGTPVAAKRVSIKTTSHSDQRSHSVPVSNTKVIQYSPVWRPPYKLQQIISESANHLKEAKKSNSHSLEINADIIRQTQPNRGESEVPSIPELIGKANEGSDESSDFVDSLSPNFGISGYPKVSNGTQPLISSGDDSKTTNTRKPIISPTQQHNGLLDASYPHLPATHPSSRRTDGSIHSHSGVDFSNNSSAVQSSQIFPPKGKVVGARIRNGIVEYKFKFPSVWRSVKQVEGQEPSIQHFMDTLTNKIPSV